jgi:PAS domain S-box-containing protein
MPAALRLASAAEQATAAEITRQRSTLLEQAHELLEDPHFAVMMDKHPSAARLAGVVAASLEQLRVAEQELHGQAERLAVAAEAMNQQIRRARDLFEASPAALIVTDPTGNVKQINPAALSLLGVSEYQAEGKPLPTYVPAEMRAAFRAQLSRVLEVGEVSGWHFVIQPRGQVPTAVCARVRVATTQIAEARVLHWCLRPDGSELTS